MAGRSKQKNAVRQTLTVHQIVAYNFRRAREENGWTQSQTSEQLEPHLGYRLNQAGVSAIEKTFDSERRRNIDVGEIVAFARCFRRPVGWFLLPPPSAGSHLLEPVDDRRHTYAADLAAVVLGSPAGWESFVGRITELLSTDRDATHDALRLAFVGDKDSSWENQINLRRRAVQQVALARYASPGDDAITSMAALLVHLVKSTPLGFAKLRDTDPEEALRLLAEGDRLVQPFIALAEQDRESGTTTGGAFGDVAPIDVAEVLGMREPKEV